MAIEQWIIFSTLVLTLVLFITGRWRYDVVALIALLIVSITGLIPVERVFSGFSNPAVITVAAVLVLSKGLQNSGVVDLIGQRVFQIKGGIVVQLAILTGFVALLSAFMNNVGALALMLPLVLELAHKKKIQPSYLLMPLAFASLLGGMTTLIGTPPNIIASAFREQATGQPFRMFDFLPVGGIVAIAGLLFIILVGWRLIPFRKSYKRDQDLFEINDYLTEVRVPNGSKLADKAIRELRDFSSTETVIVGIIRGSERRMEPSPHTKLRADDILIISADAEKIQKLVQLSGVELVGSKEISRKDLESDDVTIAEAVIAPNSSMIGGTACSLNLRSDYGVNLLAVSRQGARIRKRLDRIKFQVGDVLLLQSHIATLKETIENLGCLPLAARSLKIDQPRKVFPMLAIFIGALVVSALGWIPVQVAFVAAVVITVILRIVTLKEAYTSIDWPIIILLGAMIPVGEALETSGGAQLIANGILQISDQLPPIFSLSILLISTMFLSDLVNNAAAIVLMAPIGISIANGLGVSVDPYIIAIAIGASCAFLTPIGHQSNTLVMGPGGYHFGDYWRMGLLLEIIIVLVSLPLIVIFWPF
ncbi:MAG TPA: SLC13 family permease [Anaerolineaceae bacterium]|nr:SLC13 family permease [Anaerolineaceae bacterium]